jgi:hypothetical protein
MSAAAVAPDVHLSRFVAKGPRTTPIGLPVSRAGFIDNGVITKRFVSVPRNQDRGRIDSSINSRTAFVVTLTSEKMQLVMADPADVTSIQ